MRSVTTTEPEWDDQQQGWMLALAWYRDGLCPSCGLPREQCMDPANDGRFRAQTWRCYATEARLTEEKRTRDNPHPEARLVSIELRR